MRMILTVSALLLLIAGNALAGSGYDSCIKAEKELKAEEVSACKGMSYLLNPSSCFAKQKALKEYVAGKCRKIGVAEGVDFSVQPVTPEKKSSSAGSVSKGASTEGFSIINKGTNAGSAAVKKPEPAAAQQEPTMEQLKEENARLRAENSRLTAELEQYTKACR
jgi:hypothetical protein